MNMLSTKLKVQKLSFVLFYFVLYLFILQKIKLLVKLELRDKRRDDDSASYYSFLGYANYVVGVSYATKLSSELSVGLLN